MHDHAHHDHGPAHGTPLRALAAALAITGTVFVAEVVGGLLSGSMALLADAMHMLSDAAGLIISLIAIIVGQKAASATATYGNRRVEVLAALINAVAVLSISVWIVVEAVRRLRDPQPVETAAGGDGADDGDRSDRSACQCGLGVGALAPPGGLH